MLLETVLCRMPVFVYENEEGFTVLLGFRLQAGGVRGIITKYVLNGFHT